MASEGGSQRHGCDGVRCRARVGELCAERAEIVRERRGGRQLQIGVCDAQTGDQRIAGLLVLNPKDGFGGRVARRPTLALKSGAKIVEGARVSDRSEGGGRLGPHRRRLVLKACCELGFVAPDRRGPQSLIEAEEARSPESRRSPKGPCCGPANAPALGVQQLAQWPERRRSDA